MAEMNNAPYLFAETAPHAQLVSAVSERQRDWMIIQISHDDGDSVYHDLMSAR
jgi:hypothetical protein